MKRLLYEAPVDDFMSDEAKLKIYNAQTKKYQKAKSEGGDLAQIIYNLPNLESSYRQELKNLALALFYKKFPKIKERVNNGKITMDVEFGDTSQIRKTPQKVQTQVIQQVKETDPLFDERVKARNFINATTQGSGWSEGFNMYKEIESQLNKLDPTLVQKYKEFENGATIFYNDNTETLESMAERGAGRLAAMDIVPDHTNPGKSIIIVRAPNFPLLMHELIKAGNYFNSLLYLPKDKLTNNTLTKITDTHKHEIRNMITGREISNKLRFLWGELIDGYESWMDGMIKTQFNKMANDNPKLFNEIMYDGVLSGNPKAMEKFENFSQTIVNGLLKNQPKIEEPNFDEIIKSKIESEDDDEPEDEDYDDDDLSWMDDLEDDED